MAASALDRRTFLKRFVVLFGLAASGAASVATDPEQGPFPVGRHFRDDRAGGGGYGKSAYGR